MKFNTLDELIRHIVSESIDLSKTEIAFAPVSETVVVEPVSVKESFNAKIRTFFDSPSVTASAGTENILYVESVEGNKDFCGAGRVNVLGREIMTNLCESDGTAYVSLSIDIDGKLLENVSFKLQASDNLTKNTIRIRNDLLNEQ